MKLIRKILFWSHLVAGLAAGLVILLMAASGLLLSFERQITEAADGYRVEANGPRLTLSGLHAKLREAQPGARPTGVQIESGPTAPVVFQFGREKAVHLDPYTGTVLGEGAVKTRSFFKWVTEFHRWLAMSGKARDTGKSVTSAAALVFFFILLSGLFLWIPKRWTKRGLLAITTFRRDLRGRARDWNWHNVLGLWFALPLLLTVSTGLVIAYPWANKLLFQAVGEKPPERGGPPGGAKGKGGPQGKGPGREAPAAGPESLPAGIDAAVARVAGQRLAWQQIQFSFPEKNELKLFVTDGHRGRPDLRREFTVDLATREITAATGFDQQSTGRQLRTWVRWLHTGEALGWIGQTVSALACAATLVLIWTGFALSWRRFTRRRGAP
ncbi:PepSY-associated TM helix domain-containing protein [Luteolibacter marinus]|uniref:PepSY-associated TM helix domain-containing protein n=1 Tax=Luteolibacter marinus TaxID=2776705 RepID=UPI001866CB14|nr:PepSY-associated TM helix domain-containing protein [Luteolibacter marinus]